MVRFWCRCLAVILNLPIPYKWGSQSRSSPASSSWGVPRQAERHTAPPVCPGSSLRAQPGGRRLASAGQHPGGINRCPDCPLATGLLPLALKENLHTVGQEVERLVLSRLNHNNKINQWASSVSISSSWFRIAPRSECFLYGHMTFMGYFATLFFSFLSHWLVCIIWE